MSLRHILIVEDDLKIRQFLAKYLRDDGYVVSEVGSIGECEEIIKYFTFDLIILDVMLPDDSGLNFIKRSKGLLKVPVIILSAMGHVDDKVRGLEQGARDYITKPFEPRELLLRVRNLLAAHHKPNKVSFGDMTFDMDNKLLMRGSDVVRITQSERELLFIFCQNQRLTISREDIAKAFRELNTRSIDTMIARLRSKVEVDPKSPRHIVTDRNKGYSFWP